MRELEMRQRVERFLQTRLAKMLMPATLGLGLAVGGCGSNNPESTSDSAVAQEVGASGGPSDGSGADKQLPPDAQLDDATSPGLDTGSISVKYMAQMPDAGIDSGGAVAVYSAPVPDAGSINVKYMAPIPDAAVDLGGAVALYMAPVPDSGAIMRYMAPQPVDSGSDVPRAVALYMAPLPTSSS
jgi:hypothetical protein